MDTLETGAAEAAVPTTDVAPVSAPAEAPEPAERDLDADLAAAYDKATSEPARDETGRFKSTKEPEAVEPEDAAPAEAQTEDQTSPDTEGTEPAKPAIDPPVSWSREVREKWASIPPDVQEYIARRETEAHGQISRLGQQVKAFEPLGKVLEQYRGTVERNGMSHEKGIEALLAAQAMLDTDPRTAIHHIAATYGVDLGAPANDQQAPSRETLALQAKIDGLERRLATYETDVNAGKLEKAAAEQSALEQEVIDFQAKAPFFKEIEDDVIAMIAAVKARSPDMPKRQILEKAYDYAVKVHPTISAKIEADRKAEEAKKAREKAETAKKVASLNVKSGQTARPAPKSIDDDLAALYDNIQSRAS